MRAPRGNQSGMTLIEVMLAVSFLAVSLVALLSMLAQGSISVGAGGSQSKATAFARQTMEQLRNQPFVPGPANGPDTLEPGITRTWSIAPAGPTVAPNRLETIQVIVRVDRATGTLGAQNITLTTMRAE